MLEVEAKNKLILWGKWAKHYGEPHLKLPSIFLKSYELKETISDNEAINLDAFLSSYVYRIDRLIAKKRYVDCMSWSDLAAELNLSCRELKGMHNRLLKEVVSFYEK